MLVFFICSCSCIRPVFLIPGTMASVLKGTVHNRSINPYCPSHSEDMTFWIDRKSIIPPFVNCYADWLTLEYDEKSDLIVNRSGVSIYPSDFGGVEGINWLDESLFNINFIPYFSEYTRSLLKMGYEIKKTLFGCPFDWRLGLALPQYHWERVKNLVEKAFYANNYTKVVLIGHSLGAYFIQRLLTKFTTYEWRNKYIDSTILVAPSWSGSGYAFSALWEGKIPNLGPLGNDMQMARFIRSIGGVHIHLPNHQVYGNTSIIYTNEGKPLMAKDVPRYLLNNKAFTKQEQQILHKNLDMFSKLPGEIDIPTAIIYNSAISTLRGYNFENDQKLYGPGDGMVNAEGIEYACKKWKRKPYCKNIRSKSILHNHLTMLYAPSCVNLVLSLLKDDKWKNPEFR